MTDPNQNTPPMTAEAAFALAVQHLQAGRFLEAQQICQAILQVVPDAVDVLNLLGVLAQQQGRHDQAVGHFGQALESQPRNGALLYNLGVSLLTLGRAEEAADAFRRVVVLEPDHGAAHANLGIALQGLGDLNAALASLRRALTITPDLSEIHYNLANILKQLGALEEAAAGYRKALALRPDFAEAHNNLGDLLQAQKRFKEAEVAFRNAIEVRPDFAEAHANLGRVLQNQDNPQEAKACYEQALVLRPDFAEVHNHLGDLHREARQWEEAIRHYQRALEIQPVLVGARSHLVALLIRVGRHQEVVAILQQGLALDGDDIESLCNLGMVYQHLGQLDRAEEALIRAVTQAPDDLLSTHSLLEYLNYYPPKGDSRMPHAGVQAALQQETARYRNLELLDLGVVRSLYARCLKALESTDLNRLYRPTQIYRGEDAYEFLDSGGGCERHGLVFELFGVIPEVCFDCYKVSVEPRNVLELFKLNLVFNDVQLPKDNARKCFVELRPEISGTYKGLVYCHSLEDAREVEKRMRAAVSKRISPEIAVSTKRGCSEHALAFPEFVKFDAQGNPRMGYDEAWRVHERHVDEKLIGNTHASQALTFNHEGFTLLDAKVMQSWLGYAAAIGDPGHLEISSAPLPPLPFDRRPPFKSPKTPLDENVPGSVRTSALERAETHYRHGLACRDSGNLEEAVVALSRACDLQPDHAEAHRDLGNVLVGLRRWGEGVSCYEKALAIRPEDAAIHCNLGVALHHQQRMEAALGAFRRAIELQPGDADAHFNLITMLEENNRDLELREALAQAKRHCGRQPTILLSEARLLKRENKFAEARILLEEVGDAFTDPTLSIQYHALLGEVYDRMGETGRAYASFQNSNRISRMAAEATGADKGRYLKKIERLERQVTRAWVADWDAVELPEEEPSPLFLVGFPRSGTTLMDIMLRSHPAIEVMEEPPTATMVKMAMRKMLGDRLGDDPASLKHLNAAQVQSLRRAYFEGLYMAGRPEGRGEIIVDKQPLNFVEAALIHRLFPDARFLFIQRHPCDCVLSCFMQIFGYNDAMVNFFDLESAAHLYDRTATLWAQLQEALPLQVHTVRYEDLVLSWETCLKEVFDFLDLEWDEGVRRYAEVARQRPKVNTPSYHQVTEPIYRRASGRWQRYRESMKPVLPLLLPWARRYGYED